MRRVLHTVFLIIFSCISLIGGAAGNMNYYVSPAGDDSWSGLSSETPFASIQKAKDAVREFRRGGFHGPVTVHIGGGLYELDEALVFRPEDSGTEASPVIYRAVEGEEPILEGMQLLVFKKGQKKLSFVEHLSFSGITFRERGMRDQEQSPPVISMRDARYCVFEENQILHVNSRALEMTGENNEIKNNLIEDARIGAIRIQGRDIFIRNNVIKDIHLIDEHERSGWGICIDAPSTDIIIENNQVLRAGISLWLKSGNSVVAVKNNLFVDPELCLVRIGSREGLSQKHISITGNIFYYKFNDVNIYNIEGMNALPDEVDHNLYWNPTGCILTSRVFRGLKDVSYFSDWQALGFDSNSLIENPLFIKPGEDDFSLQEDSPYFTLRSEAKEPIRRFCFAVSFEEAGKNNFSNIQHLQIYGNNSMLFLIMDVDAGMDFGALKQELADKYEEDEQPLLRKIVSGELLPMERIYKLEQMQEYAPEEGQLEHRKLTEFRRSVSCMELHPDPASIARYRKIHEMGQAWPEITDNMIKTGILDMEIYIRGTLCYLIADMDPVLNAQWKNQREALPREKEWQDYVSPYQKTNQKTGTKWIGMEKIKE